MVKLVLLRCDLYQQALAQIARAHAGRVELLHQFDAAAQQFKRRCRFRRSFPLADSRFQHRRELLNAAASSSSLPAR